MIPNALDSALDPRLLGNMGENNQFELDPATEQVESMDEVADETIIMTAKEVLPDEFRDSAGEPDAGKIEDLAHYIYQCYTAGVEIRRPILKRIEANEALTHNRPVRTLTKRAWKGAPSHHIPVVGPRIQQRAAALVQTITGPDKMYFMRHLGSEQNANDVEDDLQFMLDGAAYDEALVDIITTALTANQCTVLVTFEDDPQGVSYSSMIGPYAGLKFEVIHPENFVVYPAAHPDLARSALTGHEFEMRPAEIESKQLDEMWFDEDIIASVDSLRTRRERPSLQQDDSSGPTKDKPVTLLECLVKHKVSDEEPERTYRVKMDPRSLAIFRIEPYEYPYSHYVTFRFYKDLNAYWCEDSPANDGQALNLLINDLMHTILVGLMFQSRQALLAKGVQKDDSLKELSPGSVIPVASLGESATISGSMPLSGFDFIISSLMTLSDAALKVPDTITGQQVNKNETATAQDIKFSGFQLMGSMDVKSIIPALRQVAMISLVLMYDNWDQIKKTYGPALKVEDPTQLIVPGTRISIAGQEPAASPKLQQEQIMSAMQLLAQVPELHALILPLTKSYINQSSMEGKEDMVAAMTQIENVLKMSPEELTAKAAEMGINPNPQQGGAPVAPGVA